MNSKCFSAYESERPVCITEPALVNALNRASCRSVPTALRLAKLFGQTPDYWLDLQREADLNEASKDKEFQDILKGITKAKKPDAPKPVTDKKPGKKQPLSDKRKKADKIPGAKPAKGSRVKSVGNKRKK